jgi:hypothetical protein
MQAWGAAIGTPPKITSLARFNERSGWVLEGDKKEEFQWKDTHPTKYNYAAGGYAEGGWSWDRNDNVGGYRDTDNNMIFLDDDCEVCDAKGVFTTWFYDFDTTACRACAAKNDYNKRMPLQLTPKVVDSSERCAGCDIYYVDSLMRGDICKYCQIPSAKDDFAEFHVKAINCAAMVSRTNPNLVEHVLFETEVDELVQQDAYMQSIWRTCDDTYSTYYEGMLNNSLTIDQQGMVQLAKKYVSEQDDIKES